jgi:predicted TIM-barrel fold metal-dependent hydrolase
MPIDTHTHLASDDLARYPLSDATPLVSEKYVNTAERFIALMDVAGIDGALAVQAFGLYGFDNSYHADASVKHSGRLVGVCGLSAALPNAPGLLRHWIVERGMAGLRLVYYGRDGAVLDENDPALLALLEEADGLHIPVCFLTTRKNLAAIQKLAQRFPGLRIALDHLGVVLGKPDQVGPSLFALAPTPNIYLKFSTPLLTAGPEYLAFLRQVIARFGVDRLMWSSDFPHTDTGGYANMVGLAERALDFLSEAERHAVFDGTALSLWPQLRDARARRT